MINAQQYLKGGDRTGREGRGIGRESVGAPKNKQNVNYKGKKIRLPFVFFPQQCFSPDGNGVTYLRFSKKE